MPAILHFPRPAAPVVLGWAACLSLWLVCPRPAEGADAAPGTGVAKEAGVPAGDARPAEATPEPGATAEAEPGSAAAKAAFAKEANLLQVADPYIELHTGPGRGYPIFHVVERDGWIAVELQHTDWYRVRTEDGRIGWVDRAQLERTLTPGGERKTFREVLLDDYLHRKWEIGAGWGHFSTDPMFKVWANYRPLDPLAVELTVGQVQGELSGTTLWQLDAQIQLWPGRRFAPFAGIGVGRIYNRPNASLVSAPPVNSNSANAMLGVRYYATDRLIVRADWAAYTSLISSERTSQFRALTLGLSFFF